MFLEEEEIPEILITEKKPCEDIGESSQGNQGPWGKSNIAAP